LMGPYRLLFTRTAERQLRKLDPQVRRRIRDFLRDRVADDPRRLGKALHGDLAGLWRYRVGDYRIVVVIEDAIVTVVVTDVEHRSSIYRT